LKIFTKDIWLSSVLSVASYKLNNFSEEIGKEILKLPSPNLIFFSVNASEDDYIEKLEHDGFYYVDSNIQFESPREKILITKINPDFNIRFAEIIDKEKIIKIASESFKNNRFYRDPRISNDDASKIKKEWVLSFFKKKRGDHIFIIEYQKKICGFLLVILQDKKLIIDLIATSHEMRGMGVAKNLISYAVENNDLDFDVIQVGTQISNIISVNLYTSMNFKPISINSIYHRHG